ncbi:hypothetical protein FJTKL_02639 [Diaporthe vaccinii]|uniref:Uncharacterized protein n=1 Tax=Diaporthe vaccinii TaxID=105482 RepID=A0ABR4DXL2_9PEZI
MTWALAWNRLSPEGTPLLRPPTVIASYTNHRELPTHRPPSPTPTSILDVHDTARSLPLSHHRCPAVLI